MLLCDNKITEEICEGPYQKTQQVQLNCHSLKVINVDSKKTCFFYQTLD